MEEEANFTEENSTSPINQDEEAMEIDESISNFLENEKTKINAMQQLHHQQKENLKEEAKQEEKQTREVEQERVNEQEQVQEQVQENDDDTVEIDIHQQNDMQQQKDVQQKHNHHQEQRGMKNQLIEKEEQLNPNPLKRKKSEHVNISALSYVKIAKIPL